MYPKKYILYEMNIYYVSKKKRKIVSEYQTSRLVLIPHNIQSVCICIVAIFKSDMIHLIFLPFSIFVRIFLHFI